MLQRAWFCAGSALLGLSLLAGCGAPAAQTPGTPTTTSVPATPTATATATASPSPVAETTCLPDPYQIYSSQTTYETDIGFGIPAPPHTKHGIGSSGVNPNGNTLGGESGICSLGTQASLAAFFNAQLPTLGWSSAAPPSALLSACVNMQGNGVHRWWKGTTMVRWDYDGDAGGGSIFWAMSYCMLGH